MRRLSGKVAVVTGGGNGMGAGMCRRFSEQGMKVVVSDIDRVAAQKICDELRTGGGQAIAVQTDVSKRDQVQALADAAVARFGSVDVACNNAGVYINGPIREMTEGDWRWIFDVNVMGVVHGSTIFGNLMAERGSGHIVNTASVGGWISDGNTAVYCSSKFAVVGLSEGLAQDLAPHGVGVTILCPGPVQTSLPNADRLRPANAGASGGSAAPLAGQIAAGMHPDEVSELVLRGIHENALYVFTHPQLRPAIEQRFQRAYDAMTNVV